MPGWYAVVVELDPDEPPPACRQETSIEALGAVTVFSAWPTAEDRVYRLYVRADYLVDDVPDCSLTA